MATNELHLTLCRNKKRIGGSVSVGMSRLPVRLIIRYFMSGHSIKDLCRFYPQVDRDDFIVLHQLAEEMAEIIQSRRLRENKEIADILKPVAMAQLRGREPSFTFNLKKSQFRALQKILKQK